jgi:hypothetical protein
VPGTIQLNPQDTNRIFREVNWSNRSDQFTAKPVFQRRDG